MSFRFGKLIAGAGFAKKMPRPLVSSHDSPRDVEGPGRHSACIPARRDDHQKAAGRGEVQELAACEETTFWMMLYLLKAFFKRSPLKRVRR